MVTVTVPAHKGPRLFLGGSHAALGGVPLGSHDDSLKTVEPMKKGATGRSRRLVACEFPYVPYHPPETGWSMISWRFMGDP